MSRTWLVRPWLALPLAAAIAVSTCERRSTDPTPLPCSYTVSNTSLTFGASGGAASVSVATADNCSWTAQTMASWLTITAGAAGTGPGTVSITASANTGSAERTGAMTVAGTSVSVQQAGLAACSYAIDPTSAVIGRNGGAGSVMVTTDGHCSWTASGGASWARITSDVPASGPGTVVYAVDANTSPQERSTTFTIAGRSFSVTQEGDASSCTYSVDPVLFTPCMAWGYDLTSAVDTEDGCPWTATSGASWITVIDGHSGAGAGVVRFGGTDNWDAPRTGVVMVRWPTVTAGQNIQIQQAGCYYSVTQSAFDVPASGGTQSFMVLQQSDPVSCGGPLQDACLWWAVSDEPWITVTTTMPQTGDNRVSFAVAANPGMTPRAGAITVRDRVVQITQAGS